MSLLAKIEAKLETIWGDITGEARQELGQLLADAKAEEAKFAPLLHEFEGGLRSAIADLEPEAKAAIESLLSKLLADAGGLIGGL